MKEKFTGGEWQIDKEYSTIMVINARMPLSNAEIEVCEIDCNCDVNESSDVYLSPTNEQLANAYLLKSAPKMYRMLNEVNELLEAMHEMSPSWTICESQVKHNLIKKLLAEARGESKDTD